MSQTFPLSLRPLESPAHKPVAWFVPGAQPAAWLEEIAGWGVPLADVRLYVVPTSVRDRHPIGVLATSAGGSPLSVPSPVRARAYARLSDRLYIPADAELFPPVSDDELRTKLNWKVCLLHPSAGLVGFADEDKLRVHDLLAPPPRRQADWDCAVPGPPPAPRLLSVEPHLPVVSLRMILDEGRDDIGSEAPDELPKLPDESSAKEALSKAKIPGLKALSWLAGKAPGGGTQSTWLNSVKNWANEKLAGVNASLAAARAKELRRLQEMLKKDPDKGLRYAIPMSMLDRSRGAAPPGANLTPRDVNFNLGRLGGGRPADAWRVPWEIQQQLLAQYREAANRELALGRYRRAAYVFAELLGDFSSAAGALKQGRHYREAALLYREQLKNPAAAAECLEQGGLLTEAAALYEELKRFEDAARLYERLDRPDDADRCYREAVAKALNAGRCVEAARLLERKLNAADEALAVLDEAWPEDDAAGVCLLEWFELLGRLGRHEQATRRLGALRAEAPPPPRTSVAAYVVGRIAIAYPDTAARMLAADAARVIAGRRLPGAASTESESLLDVVTRLAPHDRLLGRDAGRYLSRRRPPRPPPLPPKQQPAAGKGPFLMHQFRLPEHVQWKGFAAAGEYFFGHGELSDELFLVRGRWDGMVQGMYWKHERGASAHVVEPSTDGSTLYVLPLGVAAPARAAVFPTTDAFPRPAAAMTPSFLPPEGIAGACVGEDGTLWTVSTGQGGFTVAAHRADGTLASTHPVYTGGHPSAPIPMAARSGQVFIIVSTAMVHVAPSARTHIDLLPSPATHVAAAAPFTRVRVAAALAEGGRLYWEDGAFAQFGEGMNEPAVGFTRGGMLIAVSTAIGRAYRTDGKGLKLHASFASFSDGHTPVAVTATDKLNHFAVFNTDGLVKVFQLVP